MIVVDSSVWIGHLRNDNYAAARALRAIEDSLDIVVGDLILLEVLQGVRDERHAATIEQNLCQFRIEPMLSTKLAVQAARQFLAVLRGSVIYLRGQPRFVLNDFGKSLPP